MEKMPRFVKKVAKIATISAVGFMPGHLKGQDTINKIETSEQITNQIFKEVQRGVENGTLRNSPEYPDYFSLQKNGYHISYDIDADYNGKTDEHPTVEVEYSKDNTTYLLKKNPRGNKNLDVVYNYKDGSLSGAQTKTYYDFFNQTMILLKEFKTQEDYQKPISFRETTKEEKETILEDIEKIVENTTDSVTIKENLKNIEQEQEKKEIKNQQEAQERQVAKHGHELLEALKHSSILKKEVDDMSGMVVKSEPYTFKFNDGYFSFSFSDKDGNKNELKFDIRSDFYMSQARKIIKTEQGNQIQDVSNTEALTIIDDALSKVR